MSRDKAKFDNWLNRIFNYLEVEDIIAVSTNDLEPWHWKELWRIYDKYETYIGNGQAGGDYQTLGQEADELAKGVLLQASGSNWDDYEINQEVARLMDKDDD
ncbi:hypothetical protein [Calothrix sp. NIES-2098]|uniref:hypothetical protein n=1 Tax=Calothrix sp. NIES-2098 TaxID=1954171 RepID=UPI000B604052|nr:hypothetical protein NIES2098_42020 [Calothrix sp. NIES-2098]